MADKIKLVLAALLLVAGIAGLLSALGEAPTVLRLAALVAGMAAGVAVAWFTAPGQQFLCFPGRR